MIQQFLQKDVKKHLQGLHQLQSLLQNLQTFEPKFSHKGILLPKQIQGILQLRSTKYILTTNRQIISTFLSFENRPLWSAFFLFGRL